MTSAVRPAVLWDLGGVLYRHVTEILLDMAPDRGWNLVGVPLGPTGDTPDETYERMQRGEIDEQAYVEEVRRRLSAGGIDVDPLQECDFTRHRRVEAWSVLQQAHDAGHPQAVVADAPERWLGLRLGSDWKGAAWVDEVLDVADLGEPPPAPGTWALAAEALGVEPGQCLVVDDRRANCAGAEAAGMASHWVDIRDAAGSMQELSLRLDRQLPEGTP